MTLDYECPNCGQEIIGSFGDNVVCPGCQKEFETDWDYVGDSVSCWIVKEINEEKS